MVQAKPRPSIFLWALMCLQVQFAFSSFLLVVMIVAGRQLRFIQEKNLGYNREYVLQFDLSEDAYKNRDAIIRELEQSPGVTEVSASSSSIMSIGATTGDLKWEGKTDDNNVIVAPVSIAHNFQKMMGLTLKEGTGFTGTKADTTAFILNEAAVAQMRLDNPIGKRITLWQTTGSVVGVIKDFHFASLRETIKPVILASNPEWHSVIYIKTTGKEAAQAVNSAESVWKKFEARYPFDYAFMDEAFDKMYRTETRTATLFSIFSLIAMFISCLGLFGLSAFTVERRFKEIGIRKVLGASVGSITALLSREFMQLALVAMLVAAPVAYYLMHQWLSDFAYRIQLSWTLFAIAGAILAFIAFATVSFQSIRAALTNPVKSLRGE
jgi:putative ABC transport system permease protein